MKHYQDTITGQIYGFYESDNVEKLMQTNRNIPKTLTDNVKEKPSDNHVWHQGDWIHEKDKPMDYEEPISDVPSYNPAWITFLFKQGTILFNEQNKLEITLDEINTNRYNGRELSKIIAILPNIDKNCNLPILVSVDGSISIPVNETYNTKELAVNKMNEIISALFLGGINLNAIHLGDLEQGTLLEGGEYNFSYIPSDYNRFRNNGASISELGIFLHPHYINVENFKQAYNIGFDLMQSISFSPLFLVQGYHSMQLWKTADALSNLWIVVEQLTDLILNKLPEHQADTIYKALNITQAKKIHMKHKVLKEGNVISESCYNTLDKARDKRNDLVHEGKTPEHSIVEQLWVVLFELFELASGKKLDDLFKLTVNQKTQKIIRSDNGLYKKPINPKNTNFDEWKKT
jgi:hypothetical protein